MRRRHLLATLSLLVPLVPGAVACTMHASPDATEHIDRVASAATPAISEVTGFGSNPAGIKMFEHVPAKLAASPALVVVLHGCQQGAADVAGSFGWNELADDQGFVVVYPEQSTANNSLKCFNWGGKYGDFSSLARGKGENQSIKEMVDKAVASHGVDPKKVFVVGFSAGGALAAVLASTWPDVFAAGAVVAGVPYMCPTSYSEVFTCQKPGKEKTPQAWGDLVRAADQGFAGPFPRMSIWQGSADTIVGTQNRTELVKQWTNVQGVDVAAPSVTDKVDGQDHQAWKDKNGVVVVETYEIAGMPHGMPVLPSAKCGTANDAQYTYDKGICATKHIAEFFALTKVAGGDGGPTPGDGAASSSGASSSSSSSSSSSGGGSSGSSGNGASDDGDGTGNYGSTCAFAHAPGSQATAFATVMIAAIAIALVRRSHRKGA